MLTILVVAPAGEDVDGLAAGHPAVEILRARDGEETVEKLGRNRRVDAVLLLCGARNREILEEILDENPAPPPVFFPSGPGPTLKGAQALEPGTPRALFERVLAALDP